MIKTNNRYKPNQRYIKNRFNSKVNQTKAINKLLTRRGGIKL